MDKQPVRLRYGGRKSAKLVRCYWKRQINVYRVELELHPGVLDQNEIVTVEDLPKAAQAIYPKHINFARVNWKKLRLYLQKRDRLNAEAIFDGAFKRRKSMQGVTRYLRRQRIPNVHRFLLPLAVNKTIAKALEKWALQFEQQYYQETGTAVDTEHH